MTEENKLTWQDVCKYYKAKILFTASYVTKSRNVQSTLIYAEVTNINTYYSPYYLGYININDIRDKGVVAVSDCKLILRDITQLTDEEKQEVDRLDDEGIYLSYGKRLVIDYLRKISVDIDNFIASGKAVKDE